MKNDLRVGDYVRTDLGIGKIIDKVNDINDYYYNCWVADNKIGCYDKTPLSQLEYFVDNEVIKASDKLIDLIEDNDYIKIDGRGNRFYNVEVGYTGRLSIIDVGWNEYEKIDENTDIIEVITHEQMEQMSYKVGD